MHKLSTFAGLASLLLLAACDNAQDRNDASANSSANVSLPAGEAPPAPAAAVVLEGAGLRIPSASPPLTVSFGTSEAEATAVLTQALGRAPTERGVNEECGGGSMAFVAWEGELTAWFLDERFAGWDSKGALKTLEGVGVGTRRAGLATLRGFEVEESTLGTEFRSGGLSGILSSKAPDAKVTHLWGGATCVFR